MADAKISALPAATTPLAGTEELPIVQSGATDRVSIANVTAGRAVSAASLTLTTTPLAGGSGGTSLTTFGAANRIPYATSTTALTTSAGLTFDGTNLATTGSATAASFIPSGSTVPINGMYLSAANTLGWATNSGSRMQLGSAGNLSLGTTPAGDVNVYITKGITGGTTAYGVLQDATVASGVTGEARIFNTRVNTAAAAFSLSTLIHYAANQATIGAGSSVGGQYGFIAESTLTGGTSNYGFFGDIAAAANRFNFRANGTAQNYFAGDMQLDKTITAAATTGAQTINKNAGSVNFAALATSLVVTNNRVTANSIVIATVATVDTTMISVVAVPAAGSFTLTANAGATAETRVNWLVIN